MEKKRTIGSVNLLEGPILRNLIIFMIPIFISNMFQQLYNAVDTALVGNILGENSLAAIGACASIFEFLVGFCMSLASGFAIVIARAYGSGEKEKMKQSIAGALMIGVVTTILITLLSMVGLGPLLRLISTPEEIFAESLTYISLIGMFVIVMFAYNLLSGILRSIGNSFMPLIFLIISSILNIFLDYACMAWFGMGVAGAAIATIISQGVSVILCMIYIVHSQKELIPSLEDFKIEKELLVDLAGQGFSMAFMGSIVSIGSIILQSGINGLGTDVIAGHIAARKVYAISNLPFMSMSIALSTFIGQNKGANQGERILRAMKLCYVFDVIAALFVSVILWFGAPTLIRMISGSENSTILTNGSNYLYVVGPFLAVLGILIQTRFGLQGLGSKFIPLISSFIECFGKIGFTIFLIPRFEYQAVIWCEPIIWCFMTAQLIYSFNKNEYVVQTKQQIANKNI